VTVWKVAHRYTVAALQLGFPSKIPGPTFSLGLKLRPHIRLNYLAKEKKERKN